MESPQLDTSKETKKKKDKVIGSFNQIILLKYNETKPKNTVHAWVSYPGFEWQGLFRTVLFLLFGKLVILQNSFIIVHTTKILRFNNPFRTQYEVKLGLEV